MEPSEYRKLQLASISGHGGSSEIEIQLLTSVCYLSLFVLIGWNKWTAHSHASARPLGKIIFEILLFVLPQIIAVTCADYYWHLVIILTSVATALWTLSRVTKGVIASPLSEPPLVSRPYKIFIENCRGFIMLQTYLSIFAVDFSIYPRRFVKTETVGVSLMDVGVGCYIGMGALALAQSSSKRPGSLIAATCWKVAPLLFLGLARMLSVKGMDYQEHVSEYGVHWNFFMTLAFLALTTSILQSFFSYEALIILGVLMLAIYQYSLSFTELQSYLFSNVRTTLVDQNKEGLFSLIGYIVIHLVVYSFSCRWTRSPCSLAGWKTRFYKMSLSCVLLWSLYFILKDYMGILPSRRAANATFVLWTLAFFLTHVVLHLGLDIWAGSEHATQLFKSINRNPLVTFLAANLLTGITNLCTQTLLLSNATALACIFMYMCLVVSFAFVLDHYLDLRLK